MEPPRHPPGFPGFGNASSPEPCTPIPNWVFDIVPSLKSSEVKVLLYLVYQTAGMHRSTCTMGLRRLSEEAGVSREEAGLAMHSLAAAGHITIETGSNRQGIYSIAERTEIPDSDVRKTRPLQIVRKKGSQ
jgi:hypothetical protein